MGGVAGLQEVVLWTRDPATSVAFYRDRFGLQAITPPDAPRTFLRAGDDIAGVPQVIVLIPHPDPDGTFPAEKTERPLHHFAFMVEPGRFDELRTELEAAGHATRDGVHPVLKDVRTFYLDYPDGNEVEVIAADA